ncbi:MAG: hypothetical protein LAO76_16140 [Acidobacteriia bacterium]|nr:hypothetical protein [Terriglobia bacterium]
MEGAGSGDDLLPGAFCSQSGIYQVIHSAHRQPHKVLLRARDLFPRCKVCGDAVRFRLLKQISTLSPPRAKRVRKKSAGR